MHLLTLEKILEIHALLLKQSGGGEGLRDPGALESAVAQPTMTFDGIDLYETLVAKAAALGHSLIQNHPFIDGNKRIGHAAMEITLVMNGYEIVAEADVQEAVILTVASGNMSRLDFTKWLEQNVVLLAVGKTI